MTQETPQLAWTTCTRMPCTVYGARMIRRFRRCRLPKNTENVFSRLDLQLQKRIKGMWNTRQWTFVKKFTTAVTKITTL